MTPRSLEFAGPLMQWHNHGNLCWDIGPTVPARSSASPTQTATAHVGVNTGGENPMVHVWITPHPCGVFAALEGIGAGQAAVPEEQRVDMCNQAHDDHTAAAVPTKPYDPTQPIDLGGVRGCHTRAAGRCREPGGAQRRSPAAVGGLQGRRGSRLPEHRRRSHRIRALHQVGLDQRRRLARSRSPREPRVPATARRLEEARQRDVHAARRQWR